MNVHKKKQSALIRFVILNITLGLHYIILNTSRRNIHVKNNKQMITNNPFELITSTISIDDDKQRWRAQYPTPLHFWGNYCTIHVFYICLHTLITSLSPSCIVKMIVL